MDIVGKTLREVKALHENTRISKVGPVSFMLTADYIPTRVNVVLGEQGFTFKKVKVKFTSGEYEFDEIDQGDLDDGIVISYNLG